MLKRVLILALAVVGILGIVRMFMVNPEVQIEIVQQGTGAVAELGQTAYVHYTGKLENGETFDSSIPRGQPLAFVLGQGRVIRGWEEGVLGMKVGEKRVLTIPPELGYGATGAGGVIPPNATLVFEVELMDVQTPATLGQVDAAGLLDAQKNGAIVIDIRRDDEWKQTGIIEGAHTVTAFGRNGQLDPAFQETFFGLLDGADTPVLLYCRTGNRTGMLGQMLIEQAGLTNVTHLEGGIVDWQEGGHPVVPYAPN